jgi:hypothetical protein
MTKLIVPRHIAAARANSQISGPIAVADNPALSLQDEIAAPIPEGHPRAIWYRVVLTPIGLRKASKGGVLITAKTEADQLWLHGLFKVIDIGSLAFKGPSWDGCTPDEIPTVGSLVIANPKTPSRLFRNGVWFMTVNDDAIQNIVRPEHADNYAFFEGLSI